MKRVLTAAPRLFAQRKNQNASISKLLRQQNQFQKTFNVNTSITASTVRPLERARKVITRAAERFTAYFGCAAGVGGDRILRARAC